MNLTPTTTPIFKRIISNIESVWKERHHRSPCTALRTSKSSPAFSDGKVQATKDNQEQVWAGEATGTETRSATDGAYTVAAAPAAREGTFWHPHRGCRGRHFQAGIRRQILNAWHSTLPKTTPARTTSKLHSLALSLPQNSILTQYLFLPTSKPDDSSICLLREKKNRKHGQPVFWWFFLRPTFPFLKRKEPWKRKSMPIQALSAWSTVSSIPRLAFTGLATS